jgi:murein DD-endopeptidase MepM/ murein hydrolase activator NlpD
MQVALNRARRTVADPTAIEREFIKMTAFSIDMSSPFPSGSTGDHGGPNSGGHKGPKWYNQFGMDLDAPAGTEVRAAFDGYVTVFHPHDRSKDNSTEYGAEIFVRSDNDKMGAYYTHITDVSAGLEIARQSKDPSGKVGVVRKGALVGKVFEFPGTPPHLHLALVEIIGGLPGGIYKGVDLFALFKSLANTTLVKSVTFKQDGSPPTT